MLIHKYKLDPHLKTIIVDRFGSEAKEPKGPTAIAIFPELVRIIARADEIEKLGNCLLSQARRNKLTNTRFEFY